MLRVRSRNRPYDILIVEDSADDVELFLRASRKVQVDLDMDINAHPVSDGAEAIAITRRRRYDAIFLDVNMPPPDGVELTKQIRSSGMNQTTTIVILTGAGDRGLMTRAFQAGQRSLGLKIRDVLDRATSTQGKGNRNECA